MENKVFTFINLQIAKDSLLDGDKYNYSFLEYFMTLSSQIE